jgi:hypothetical protein
VVVVPAAALGVAAIAVVPRWRERYGVLVALIATVGLVLVPVATRSGNALNERLDTGGVVKRQIQDHADIANLVIWPTLALWVLAVLLVLMTRQRRTDRMVTVVAVLAVIAAGAAAGTVALAGHRGSTAVWSCTIGSDACK